MPSHGQRHPSWTFHFGSKRAGAVVTAVIALAAVGSATGSWVTGSVAWLAVPAGHVEDCVVDWREEVVNAVGDRSMTARQGRAAVSSHGLYDVHITAHPEVGESWLALVPSCAVVVRGERSAVRGPEVVTRLASDDSVAFVPLVLPSSAVDAPERIDDAAAAEGRDQAACAGVGATWVLPLTLGVLLAAYVLGARVGCARLRPGSWVTFRTSASGGRLRSFSTMTTPRHEDCVAKGESDDDDDDDDDDEGPALPRLAFARSPLPAWFLSKQPRANVAPSLPTVAEEPAEGATLTVEATGAEEEQDAATAHAVENGDEEADSTEEAEEGEMVVEAATPEEERCEATPTPRTPRAAEPTLLQRASPKQDEEFEVA